MASLNQIDSKQTTQQDFTDTHLILTEKGSISVTNQFGAALKLNFSTEDALTLNLNGNVTIPGIAVPLPGSAPPPRPHRTTPR